MPAITLLPTLLPTGCSLLGNNRLEFDWAGTLDRFDGDSELVLEIINLFSLDWPRVRQSIAQALDAGDRDQLKQALHRLMGSLGNFEAPAALEAAATLDRLARSGDMAQARGAWIDLEPAMARVLLLMKTVRS